MAFVFHEVACKCAGDSLSRVLEVELERLSLKFVALVLGAGALASPLTPGI
jgi:hypothetical protein